MNMIVGALHNVDSGKNRKKGYQEIWRLLAADPCVHQLEVKTPADMESVLETFKREHTGLILINGGDGTVQAILTILYKLYVNDPKPLLAVIPSGTTNMIAGDIGLRGKRERAVRRLLESVRENRVENFLITRPILRVSTERGQIPVYGMFFGGAGIYAGIEYCRNKIHTLGLSGELGPALAMLNVIGSFAFGSKKVLKPSRIQMDVNKESPVTRDCMLIYATTLERFFLGLRPFLKTSSAPVYFSAIESNPKHMLRILPSFVRGKRHRLFTRENGYESRNIERVALHLEGGFTLDGEMYSADENTGPVIIEHAGQISFVRCN